MPLPELNDRPLEVTVEVQDDRYFTVQHRTSGSQDWPHTTPALFNEQQAWQQYDDHAHWYDPQDIRVVEKTITTTTVIKTRVLDRKESASAKNEAA